MRKAQQEQSPASIAAPCPPSYPASFYAPDGRLMVKNMSLEQLSDWVEEALGEPRSRGLHLWRAMYHTWPLVEDLRSTLGCQGGFSAAFCHKFAAVATLDGGLELEAVHSAPDGTRKLALRLTSGPARGAKVEAVLIPMPGSTPRLTVCVSSQVGCAMNCQFCFTGRMGLGGNLSAAQIVQQVVLSRRLVYEEDSPRHRSSTGSHHVSPVNNVVFMGMGEPLDNLAAVMAAVEVLRHPLGLSFSANRVCVSTVGLVPAMEQFCARSRACLAVSLHATTDEVRDWLVPANRRYPLTQVMAALERLFPRDKSRQAPGKRHVLVQYVLLAGVNDGVGNAARLAAMLSRVCCKINLIAFNPHAGTAFAPSTPAATATFADALRAAGHVVTLRASRGGEEMAACGQLGSLAGQAGLPRMLPPPPWFRGTERGGDT